MRAYYNCHIIGTLVIKGFAHLMQNMRRLWLHHRRRAGQSECSIGRVHLPLVFPMCLALTISCSECHTAVLPLSICAGGRAFRCELILVKSVDGYSMNMRLARWSYNEIRFMARWGNKRANAFVSLFVLLTSRYWAATLPPNPLWGSHRFTSKIHRCDSTKT